jgi:hypothetical protein
MQAEIKLVLPYTVSLGNKILKAPLLVLQLRATKELSPVGKGIVEDLKARVLSLRSGKRPRESLGSVGHLQQRKCWTVDAHIFEWPFVRYHISMQEANTFLESTSLIGAV